METDEKQNFKKLVANAVKEGLALLREKQPNPHGYFNWPSLSFYENGIPNMRGGYTFSGPPDYKSVFEGYKPLFPAAEIASFQNLLSYIKTQDWILERLLPDRKVSNEKHDEIDKKYLDHFSFRIPVEIIDRYIHIHETMEFQNEKFELIYEPLARSIILDKLGVDICVPILFVKFDFESIVLGENVSIVRMDELFHLARFPLQSYGSGVHPSVLSAATHCLMLKDWNITNSNYLLLSKIFSDAQVYPLEPINNFFASLRLIAGVHTGYSQVLLQPANWAMHYKGNLPPLEGTSINAYPSWFEYYYWLDNNIPVISELTAREIGNLYFDLVDVKENSIRIAVRRLNLCFLRENDEDYILDATIGLESLLSDDNRQEMTYKLAMRMGALAKLENISEKKPSQVFDEIKKIYGYRSAVVHGSKQTDKKREIVLSDNSKVPASALAIEYLRMAIKALIQKSQI